MKKRALFYILFIILLSIGFTGCYSGGIYWGPDMEVRTYNLPSINDYTLVVVNDSRFPAILYLNGNKIYNVAPWSQRNVAIRQYYINYCAYNEFVFTIRFDTGNGIVTFSKRIWINNYNSRSESWRITNRMILNKLRYSQ